MQNHAPTNLRVAAWGRFRTFTNGRFRPRLCENSEISLSAKNFSHFAFNSGPATAQSWDDMLVLGK